MASRRKIYGYLVVNDIDTGDEVDRIAVHYPRDSHMTDRVEEGLAINFDFERFTFGWEDA